MDNQNKAARQWEADNHMCVQLNQWYEHKWEAGQEDGVKQIEIYEILPNEPCVFVAECENDLVAQFLIEARSALPYWLEETRKLCFTISQQRQEILSLQIATNKMRELLERGSGDGQPKG